MQDKIEVHTQNQYLGSLFNRHSSTISLISAAIMEKQEEYQKRIQEGQFKIRKHPFNYQSSSSFKARVGDYLSNRSFLQSQLKIISSQFKGTNNQNGVTDEQRKRFVREMRIEQQKLNRKKEENARAEEIRQKKKEEDLKTIKQQQEYQRRENKKRKIEFRLEELNGERQRRELQIKYRNRQYQMIAQEKLLVDKMIDNYNHQQSVSLEEKKRKLAEIRQIHKPLSKQQFEQHWQRIKEKKQLLQRQKEQQSLSNNAHSQQKKRYYKSKWYKDILNEQIVDQDKLIQQSKEMVVLLKDRGKKYSEYIRHNFVPESDQKLVEELNKRIGQPIKRKKPKEIRQMGLNNLQYSKEKIISKEKIENTKTKQLKIAQPVQQKSKNYLQQLKKNRRSNSLNEHINNNELVTQKKKQLLKTFATQLQQKARMREQLQKVKHTVVDEQLDNMYISALNAKLNILNKK